MNLLVTKVLVVIMLTTLVTSNYVFAAKATPDISSDGIKLGKLLLRNGETRTAKASAANFHTNGRCMFEASYKTLNKGKGEASGKFINVLKRNGKLVRRNNISNLKAGVDKEHKFLLALSSGENTLELLLDNSDSLKESSEKNNKVTVNLNIVGKCIGKQRPAKK